MADYVLIPGAGGEAWYWHLVVPLLERWSFIGEMWCGLVASRLIDRRGGRGRAPSASTSAEALHPC